MLSATHHWYGVQLCPEPYSPMIYHHAGWVFIFSTFFDIFEFFCTSSLLVTKLLSMISQVVVLWSIYQYATVLKWFHHLYTASSSTTINLPLIVKNANFWFRTTSSSHLSCSLCGHCCTHTASHFFLILYPDRKKRSPRGKSLFCSRIPFSSSSHSSLYIHPTRACSLSLLFLRVFVCVWCETTKQKKIKNKETCNCWVVFVQSLCALYNCQRFAPNEGFHCSGCILKYPNSRV